MRIHPYHFLFDVDENHRLISWKKNFEKLPFPLQFRIKALGPRFRKRR